MGSMTGSMGVEEGTMRAVVQRRYGPSGVLECTEVDRPTPGARDVLVRVHAAAVHPGDHFIMIGVPYVVRMAYGLRRPRHGVRGRDLAGRIDAVGADATVHSTRGQDAEVGDGASVGPFTHLRAGTRLAARTKAGAYVETKNAVVARGSKIPHLSYVGDATVGEDVNVACGVITVNYDGFDKHHTTIEDGVFVGCDTMLVAPVTIGAGAYTAAGSTLTEDVPADALAIARSRQTVKDGWAARWRDHHGA
jgi:acetyltransferase-like isoleucine patch superfamily enzyme